MATQAELFFPEVPAAFRDTLGQAFEVADLDAFLYTYTDALPGATIVGSQLFYSNGQDGEGFYTWTYAIINIISRGGDGAL